MSRQTVLIALMALANGAGIYYVDAVGTPKEKPVIVQPAPIEPKKVDPVPPPPIPPAPVPTPPKPVNPIPPANVPLSLVIDWPAPSVAGELITISAKQSTGVRSVIWHVTPGGFNYRWNPERMELYFSTRKAGTYTISVVASDTNGNQTTADHELELLSPVENNPTPASLDTSRAKDYNTLARSLIGTVHSGSKTADALRLADDFRTAASLVRTDKVTDKAGLEQATLDLAKHDLGAGFDAWEPFFVGLDKALETEPGGLNRLVQIWNAAAQELEKTQ